MEVHESVHFIKVGGVEFVLFICRAQTVFL